MNLSSAFSGLFSLTGLIAFLFGAGSVRLYYWVKCNWWNKRHPDNKRTVSFNPLIIMWSLIFIATGVIGVQEQRTADDVRALAHSTAECQIRFTEAITARAEISEDNDKWSYIQRTAIGDWLHAILIPPPDIAELRVKDPMNPRIQQWGIDITRRYNDVIQEAQREQDQNMAERKQHPLPDPSCGKSR